MAISYVAGKILEIAARTSMELEKPAGSEAGDIILIWPYIEVTALKTITVKQGEVAATQITPTVLFTGAFEQGAYWVKHDGTSSKIKVTWEGSENKSCVLVLDGFRGVDQTTPIDVTSVLSTASAATSAKWASITTTKANCWQVGMQVNGSGVGLKETPAGWTLRTNYSPQTFSILRAAAGATGETEIKWTAAQNSIRMTLALRPAGATAWTITVEDKVESKDTFSDKAVVKRAVADSVEAKDTSSRGVGKTQSDKVEALDSIAKNIGKNVTDSVTVSDTVILKEVDKRTIIDTVTVTDEVTIVWGHKEGADHGLSVGLSYPPDDIAVLLHTPEGQLLARWSEDEGLPENVLGNITISDEMPGGCKNLGGVLPRSPQKKYQDLETFLPVTAILPGGDKVYDGYLDKTPDISGDQENISPLALGWSAAMEDENSIFQGYINTDTSGFGAPSLQYTFDLQGTSKISGGSSATPGLSSVTGNNGVVLDFSAVSKIEGIIPTIAAVWYGGGAEIGVVFFDYHMDNSSPWENYMIMGKDDRFGFGAGQLLSSNFTATVTSTEVAVPVGGAYQPPGSGYKYVAVYASFTGTGAFQMTNVFWAGNIKILGTSGLPFLGTWPNVGFSAQQMLIHLLTEHGGVVGPGEIEDDGFIIEQAWYAGMKLSDIVKDLIKYGFYDWFFYDGPKLEYRKPASYGRKWKSSVAASNLNETGLESSRIWKDVIVQWTDTSGKVRTIGPPGSGATYTSSLLEITDPDNPAVKAKRNRDFLLQIQNPISEPVALQLGVRFLEESVLINRSGSATLKNFVMDDKGIFRPVAQVKSGDWIEFTDSHDPSPRKIIHKNFTHEGRQCEIDLDAPASGMDALLERLNAVLIPLGLR